MKPSGRFAETVVSSVYRDEIFAYNRNSFFAFVWLNMQG